MRPNELTSPFLSLSLLSVPSRCTLLHRTAGDTERRYHLRYYKTGICVYDTDSRGFCAKNGAHCAFAHGQNDLRNPLYDIHEMTIHNSSLDDQENGNMMNGYSTSLDKDRNALNEDPRWQDTAFVLSNYKTELCKKPPRLCRQVNLLFWVLSWSLSANLFPLSLVLRRVMPVHSTTTTKINAEHRSRSSTAAHHAQVS